MHQNLIDIESQLFFQTYKRLPVEIDYAKGMRIFDKDGNSYLDFLGGIAVNALGHSHPGIIEAIDHQLRRYMHVSNYFYQDTQLEFVEKLNKLSGFERVFLSNSGTEANEGAIKLVRRWGIDRGKTDIIAFSGGFHGRTYGVLSLMDKPHYKDKMGPYLDNMKIIKYNDIDDLNNTVNDKTVAVILEFIQGEGGISMANEKWVDAINILKQKFGFLVIADEIQSGVGRTGKFFSFENYNINPDIVTLAKGLGGGLPLGCILAHEDLANVWEKGMHGTTFGGNPVACAAGSVVLKELKNGLMEHVIQAGKYLHERLEYILNKFPGKVLEVRGLGLIKGLLLNFDAGKLVAELLKRKIIANAASGSVLRLVPPLVVTNQDIDEFISGLSDALIAIE